MLTKTNVLAIITSNSLRQRICQTYHLHLGRWDTDLGAHYAHPNLQHNLLYVFFFILQNRERLSPGFTLHRCQSNVVFSTQGKETALLPTTCSSENGICNQHTNTQTHYSNCIANTFLPQVCEHCSYRNAKEYQWQNKTIILAADYASNGIYNFIIPLRAHFRSKTSLNPIILLLERRPDIAFLDAISYFPLVSDTFPSDTTFHRSVCITCFPFPFSPRCIGCWVPSIA